MTQLALQELVAFKGGVFARLLRLDLNKEWITKTVEVSRILLEELAKHRGPEREERRMKSLNRLR